MENQIKIFDKNNCIDCLIEDDNDDTEKNTDIIKSINSGCNYLRYRTANK
jgi:hypothetical protein